MMSGKLVSFSMSVVLVLALALVVSCAPPGDAGVTAAVKSKMAADPTVKAFSIEVDTKDKVVTLTGNVDTQAEKDRAIELARETGGVIEVVDMISVRTAEGRGDAPGTDRGLGERLDDASITMAVKDRLRDDPMIRARDIDVDTREGVVFLTGVVATAEEKERAIELARSTEAVRDVQANLEVQSG